MDNTMAQDPESYCEPLPLWGDEDLNGTFIENLTFPFDFNISDDELFPDFPPVENVTKLKSEKIYYDLHDIAYDYILPTIFIFGLIGNILNIVIFSKSRFRHSLDEVEKSATTGLMALAISDLLFCVFGIPGIFMKAYTSYAGERTFVKVIVFVYRTYRTSILNVFLFSSTWLTVAISIERYLAVCYPLHVRWLVRVKRTIMIDGSIYIVSILFNLPEFLKYKQSFVTCPDNQLYALNIPRHPFFDNTFKMAYRLTWTILGAFIPVVILTVCNTRLILEVSRSKARYGVDKGKYTTSRITIILITIIVLHVVLVFPSLIITLLMEVFTTKDYTERYYRYLAAMVVTNIMQSINFAINFILYCIISKTFRENLKRRTCKMSKIHSNLKTTPRTSSEESKHRYHLVDVTTNSTRVTATNGNGGKNNVHCLT